MIGRETTREFNVAMHGDCSAGVQTVVGMFTGTQLFTTVLQTALRKVHVFFLVLLKF